jgi:hypothetical protein
MLRLPSAAWRTLPGKKISTTGAGVGGAFVMPARVFSRPFNSYLAAVGVPNAAPLVSSRRASRSRARSRRRPGRSGGSMVMNFPAAALHAFKKSAWMTQTGRGGQMFTWCWAIRPASRSLRDQADHRQVCGRRRQRVRRHDGLRDHCVGHVEPRDRCRRRALGLELLAGMGSQPTGRVLRVAAYRHTGEGPALGGLQDDDGGHARRSANRSWSRW